MSNWIGLGARVCAYACMYVCLYITHTHIYIYIYILYIYIYIYIIYIYIICINIHTCDVGSLVIMGLDKSSAERARRGVASMASLAETVCIHSGT